MSAWEQLTENVESMNKDDIDKIVGEVTGTQYQLNEFGSLLHNQTIYYLASICDDHYLWDVRGDVYIATNMSYGIRAKVTLVEGVRRTVDLQQCINLQGRHGADPYRRKFKFRTEYKMKRVGAGPVSARADLNVRKMKC